MAQQLNIPIMGVIENMSYAVCPSCGEQIQVFGPSNAAEVAVNCNTQLLGRLPINPEITALADSGQLESYAATEFEPLVLKMQSVLPKTATTPLVMKTK